jgi:hypothetical protein
MSTPIMMWRLNWGEIKRVECKKVTACYVWPADDRWGGREARQSDWHSYYETWAEAHNAQLAQADDALARARSRLECAQADYERIKGMKPPAEAEVQPDA